MNLPCQSSIVGMFVDNIHNQTDHKDFSFYLLISVVSALQLLWWLSMQYGPKDECHFSNQESTEHTQNVLTHSWYKTRYQNLEIKRVQKTSRYKNPEIKSAENQVSESWNQKSSENQVSESWNQKSTEHHVYQNLEIERAQNTRYQNLEIKRAQNTMYQNLEIKRAQNTRYQNLEIKRA